MKKTINDTTTLQKDNYMYNDFRKPNRVVFYGTGELVSGTESSPGLGALMILDGVNVVAFCDSNKSGEFSFNAFGNTYTYPIISINDLTEDYKDCIVVISTKNGKFITQIEQTLTQNGVTHDRILNWNNFRAYSYRRENNDRFVKSNKCNCSFFNQIKLGSRDIGLTFCFITHLTKFPFFPIGDDFKKVINDFLDYRNILFNKLKEGFVPIECENCEFLTDKPILSDKVNLVNNSYYPSVCQLDCIYCNYRVSKKPNIDNNYELAKESKNYEMFSWLINCLIKRDLLSINAQVFLASGEITIHPDKEMFYDYLLNLKNTINFNYTFFTNALVYEQKLADLISYNKNSSILCDLDAGTPETYKKVKGFDVFYKVIENLKEYRKYGNVKMKYIVIPGVNDSDDDFYGTVNILRQLQINQLVISADYHKVDLTDESYDNIKNGVRRFIKILNENSIQYDLKRGDFADLFSNEKQ